MPFREKKKVEDFILEKAFFLINESILTYSDDFISLLKKIDSPISTALLRLRNDDKDLVANYFDIDTRDTITFISDKKAKELEEILNPLIELLKEIKK